MVVDVGLVDVAGGATGATELVAGPGAIAPLVSHHEVTVPESVIDVRLAVTDPDEQMGFPSKLR